MKHRLAAFFAIFSLLVAGLVVGSTPETSEAAEARNFDPGNIISDQLFYNDISMSAAAVQSVLNSRVSACRSGYTCLKDFRENTPNRAAVSPRRAEMACAAQVAITARPIAASGTTTTAPAAAMRYGSAYQAPSSQRRRKGLPMPAETT